MDLNWMLDEYDGIVYVSDMKTYELKYINRAGRQMCGIDKNDFLVNHKKCYELLQGLDSPCSFCTNRYLQETNFYEWEYENEHLKRTFLLKDRKFMWDGCESRIEFAVDISAYRNKIASKEREKDSVLKSLPGGIAQLDARDLRTILWYGANFLTMIGYTKEQFENELHSKCDYVHPDDIDKITEIMETLKQTGKIVMTEMKIITRSGEVRTLMTTFSYEEAGEEGIPSIYSIGIDITEIKKQQELQQKALQDAYYAARMANKAKTDFLSSMSHDIRTPMNAILGMTAIAEANIMDPVRVTGYLRKINNSSKHLLDLINEVLDMSKIESGKMDLAVKSFDLAELVQNVFDVCRPLMMDKNHKIKINVGHVKHEKLVGDEGRIQQVLVNILSNAIKYTYAEGNIIFEIEEKPTHLPDASVFRFIIEDNGIGMSEDFIKRIFEPFSRAEDSRINKIQGTGLGMAISENIIHMMNGSIQVDSHIGKGSRFIVSLPLMLQDEKEEMIKEFDGLKVLVADNDKDICESTCLLLKEMGMQGKWVLKGQEAVREVINAHNNRQDYFAVILDWKMPVMSGLETAIEIRHQVGLETPIIIVSAYDYSDVEEEFIESGINAYITKPLFKSKLVRVFHQFIHGSQDMKQQEIMKVDGERLKGRHLLLVEDNAINQEIAYELLRMAGADVDTAENGRDAIEKFLCSELNYYDVILMDIQMPVMNGFDATSAIRKLDREDANSVSIIALTANAFSEDVLISKKVGMNEHIAKPIDSETLYRIIEKWIP